MTTRIDRDTIKTDITNMTSASSTAAHRPRRATEIKKNNPNSSAVFTRIRQIFRNFALIFKRI